MSTEHAWKPSSPCGSCCLPKRETVSRVGRLRQALRLTCAVVVLLLGIVLAAALPLMRGSTGRTLVRSWFRGLLWAFGVRVVLDRWWTRTGRGVLVVTNHVSWLDVVALQAVHPMRMLAKEEVGTWPVIGPLADRAGTLYIDRDRLTGLPAAVDRLGAALRAGSVVGAFPEGTTWCGLASGRYRPAVFQAAVDAGALVRPVSLRFGTSTGRLSTSAAFVGEMSLVESVREVARVRGLTVELGTLPAVDARRVRDRRELARRCEAAVSGVTLPELPHPPVSLVSG